MSVSSSLSCQEKLKNNRCRGSVLLSRLSLLYPDSFQAYGWIGLCFMEPITTRFDLDAVMAYTKELLGYEGYAYWQFFLRDDAHSVIQQHVSRPRSRPRTGLTPFPGRQLSAASVS